MWCIPPRQNATFVATMEDVLEVYSRPYELKVHKFVKYWSEVHTKKEDDQNL